MTLADAQAARDNALAALWEADKRKPRTGWDRAVRQAKANAYRLAERQLSLVREQLDRMADNGRKYIA